MPPPVPTWRRMRTLEQLVAREESALPVLLQALRSAEANPCEVLPPDKGLASETLVELQQGTDTFLGTVAFHTGGLSFHHGFLRVLGSGEVRSLRRWSRVTNALDEGYALIADDVLGGFFALNRGGFAAEAEGGVFFLPPDRLEWQSLDVGYSEFLNWCVAGDYAQFYEPLGWEGWDGVERPGWGDAFAFAPPPWTVEAQDLSRAERTVVPVGEIWRLKREFRATAG